ncbi:MAG: hypothetical protein KAY37_13945, partial [Phycisphaerae bacterium]|nr:hypothetical protein [Phycisphaerae bacterium]
MKPPGLPLTDLLPLLSLLLLALGAWLFITGRFPKRQGDTPFCRKCGYNLTGLATGAINDRCPECGSSLIPSAIVIGERRIRKRWMIVGVVLGLLGLAVCRT